MQKFSQFYVTYRNIVQFDHDFGKLDYFEKSVLKLMAGPVPSFQHYWLLNKTNKQTIHNCTLPTTYVH